VFSLALHYSDFVMLSGLSFQQAESGVAIGQFRRRPLCLKHIYVTSLVCSVLALQAFAAGQSYA
jgi:hypothetical protein